MVKYVKKFRCMNCDFEKYFFIPNGVNFMDYLNLEICSNCGCKMLQKKKR